MLRFQAVAPARPKTFHERRCRSSTAVFCVFPLRATSDRRKMRVVRKRRDGERAVDTVAQEGLETVGKSLDDRPVACRPGHAAALSEEGPAVMVTVHHPAVDVGRCAAGADVPQPGMYASLPAGPSAAGAEIPPHDPQTVIGGLPGCGSLRKTRSSHDFSVRISKTTKMSLTPRRSGPCTRQSAPCLGGSRSPSWTAS